MSDSSEDTQDFLPHMSMDPFFFFTSNDLSAHRHPYEICKINHYLEIYLQKPQCERDNSLVKHRLVEMLIEALKYNAWSDPLPVELWGSVIPFLDLDEVKSYFIQMRENGEMNIITTEADALDRIVGVDETEK